MNLVKPSRSELSANSLIPALCRPAWPKMAFFKGQVAEEVGWSVYDPANRGIVDHNAHNRPGLTPPLGDGRRRPIY